MSSNQTSVALSYCINNWLSDVKLKFINDTSLHQQSLPMLKEENNSTLEAN